MIRQLSDAQKSTNKYDPYMLKIKSTQNMKITATLIVYSLLLIHSHIVTAAQDNEPAITMNQLLLQSIKRIGNKNYHTIEQVNDVSPWLAAAPSVRLSLLQSDNSFGNDEYEISVNLPIKTRQHRRLDSALVENSENLKAMANNSRKLLISGLIRESLWSYILAKKMHEIESKKYDWLKKQRTILLDLIAVGDKSSQGLLFLEKRLLNAELLMLELSQQAEMKISQYEKITGSRNIPQNYIEASIANHEMRFNSHPQVQVIQSELEQSTLIYHQSGSASDPWNVALTAKEVRNIDINEKQLGVQLEIPLAFTNRKTQVNKSIWLKEQTDLSFTQQNLYRTFISQFAALKTEHSFLLQKQTILLKQKDLTKDIFSQLHTLQNSNELELDIFYQRMVELQASIYQAELNQIYINQNQSRQNQLVGVSL